MILWQCLFRSYNEEIKDADTAKELPVVYQLLPFSSCRFQNRIIYLHVTSDS
jgi:hypothetical protein